MENDAATLYCPNENCQAANPLTHNFCQQCRTPLPRRYLWAVQCTSVGNPGEILLERYLVIKDSIVLDTKPGLVPQTLESDNLQQVKAYLRLFPYRLHVPQVYGVLPLTNGNSQQEILLLEKPPIYAASNTPLEVQLHSNLTTAWRDASSMRQLNLLWQLANLWQPLNSEGVTSSLLEEQLIRVEGSLVRLLELRSDSQSSLSLPELGEFWRKLLPQAKPAIADFVKEICRSLIQGEIHSSEQLIAILDQGLTEVGIALSSTIKIATKSDTGPSRQRNEDACYPPSGSLITKPPSPTPLAIVCDGIGGHEGGNVASKLAIDTITEQLTQLTKSNFNTDPASIQAQLEHFSATANDIISQRNDSEHRSGRQRMGTTLVMALPIAHSMYVAHVGDSRAYWITKWGCYQVTLDDDVASREVRLGYAVYRDAVQQGASGSLVQALGMSPSSSLHPTAQRFVLDEDSVFLLCSDGLSDFDRVEQYWETEILPIIEGKASVADVTNNLVELANNINKHDNVTVALLHYQVKYSEPKSNLKAVLTKPDSTQPSLVAATQNRSSNQKTQVVSTNKQALGLKIPLQLIILSVLVVVGGLAGYFGGPLLLRKNASVSVPQATASPPNQSIDSSQVELGQVIQTNSELKSEIVQPKSNPSRNKAITAPGSVLLLLSKPKEARDKLKNSWVYLQVCSIGSVVSGTTPSPTAPNAPQLSSGDVVRISYSEFTKGKYSPPQDDVAFQCAPGNASVTSPTQSSFQPTPTPTGRAEAASTGNTPQTRSKTDSKR